MSTTTATRSPYARMFALPGAKAFCLSAALARLPMSMMSLGIVLALNHLYNNWTIAGSMSGASPWRCASCARSEKSYAAL